MHNYACPDDSFEVSPVSSDDGVNADTEAKMTSYAADVADKRRVKPMFRLGRRRSADCSDESRHGSTDRRSTMFRLGRRSASDSFQVNYEDDNNEADMFPAKAAPDQRGPVADGLVYDDFANEWWPTAHRDVDVYRKNSDDDRVSAAGPSFRPGKRRHLQPTFRMGRSNLAFRLGKRFSTNPTFRLGKRERALEEETKQS